MLRLSCTRSRSQIRPSAFVKTFLASSDSDSKDPASRSQSRPPAFAQQGRGTPSNHIPLLFQVSTVPTNAYTQWTHRRNFWSFSSSSSDKSQDTTSSSTDATSETATPTSSETVLDTVKDDTVSVDTIDAESNDGGSVDETLDRLFAENLDASGNLLESAGIAWEPTWYNVADQAVLTIKNFHDLAGVEYGWAIIGVTCLLRLGLFPLMVMSQRQTSRMAHVNPELKEIQARYQRIKNPTRKDQMQFSKNMKDLFQRYDAKPIRAFIAPLFQLPLFMGMFFGLQKMGKIFPEEFATGGILWFSDLTASDPYYVLPVVTTLTFVFLTESTKSQIAMAGPQGGFMVNFMRLMSVVMFPVLFTFDASMLCYWATNNTLTAVQTHLLMSKSVRETLGIWERPKPVPGEEVPSIFKEFENLTKRVQGKPVTDLERMKRHNQAIDTKNKAYAMMNQGKGKNSS